MNGGGREVTTGFDIDEKAVLAQIVGNQAGQRRIVFHQQQFCGHGRGQENASAHTLLQAACLPRGGGGICCRLRADRTILLTKMRQTVVFIFALIPPLPASFPVSAAGRGRRPGRRRGRNARTAPAAGKTENGKAEKTGDIKCHDRPTCGNESTRARQGRRPAGMNGESGRPGCHVG
ncbi:hypothetical protein [Microvirgula aerodenitrificans]|uniref:hypothetical protein n=1 Tax=Microvirgula aerodenitrificans TaxID=57480 RepID=UPI002F3F944B